MKKSRRLTFMSRQNDQENKVIDSTEINFESFSDIQKYCFNTIILILHL